MVIHPLLLHFPIALLVVGDLALLLDLLRPGLFVTTPATRLGFEGFLNVTLGLGYAGLVLTVVTGLFDMQAGPKTQARDGWLTVAVIHIICGVSLLVVYGVLLYRRFVVLPPSPLTSLDPPDPALKIEPARPEAAPRCDWLSVGLIIVGLILLVVVGWLGGKLVYDYRVGIS